MSMTDPIADMLTRIRNAQLSRKDSVDVPASNLKEEVARILVEEGYVRDFKRMEDKKQGILRLVLKYSGANNTSPAISGITRISAPGRRVYVGSDEIPRVLDGLGIAILSTSKGVLTDKASRQQSVGGEVLCYVW